MLDAGTTLEPRGDRSSDAGDGEHVILWSWKGTYVFAECGDRKCPAYRIVVEKCPGPCKVHIDADGPTTKLRLDGVGHGTSNRYQLEVRFTNDRAGAKSDASSTTTTFSPNAVLLTLERLPGDHTMLLFGKLESPNKIPSLMIRSPQ